MSHDEFESEPIPGLPELLPAGEELLWQGSPSTWPLARGALHTGKVAVYFAALVAWSIAANASAGAPLGEVALAALRVAAVGAAGMALLALLARWIARTTIYTITSERVVMRYGVAFPLTLNIPFKQIATADLKLLSDGSGDIALRPMGDKRLGYAHLWPHVRGWRLRNPEPTLRAVADANVAAGILAEAMKSACRSSEQQAVPKQVATYEPHGRQQVCPVPSAAVAA